MNADNAEAGAVRPAKAEDAILGAVVCPLIKAELPQALKNLKYWNDEMPPGPPATAGQGKPRLIFSFNCAEDAVAVQALREAWDAAPKLAEAFSDMDVRFLDLPPEFDLYIRNPTGPAPRYGNKSGPNFMFYETMKALRHEARFVFLMEVDCVPLQQNWLRKLARVCTRNDDAWVIGAHYSGASPLSWRVARHINGNALYQVGSEEFWTFLEGTLWPWMIDYIQRHDPDLAYDCAWEMFLNREEMDHIGHHDWIVSRGVFHRFRLTDAVLNIGGHAEQSGHYVWTKPQLLNRFPGAIVVHGPVGRDLLHRRGKYSVGRALFAQSRSSDAGDIVFAGETGQFSRSIWPAEGAIEPAQTVSALMWIRGAAGQVIAIDLRSPAGGIVSRRKIFIKDEAPRRIRADFAIEQRFNYLNLVIMVLRQAEEPEEIVISELILAIGEGDDAIRIKDFARA